MVFKLHFTAIRYRAQPIITNRAQHLHDQLVEQRRHSGSYLQLTQTGATTPHRQRFGAAFLSPGLPLYPREGAGVPQLCACNCHRLFSQSATNPRVPHPPQSHREGWDANRPPFLSLLLRYSRASARPLTLGRRAPSPCPGCSEAASQKADSIPFVSAVNLISSNSPENRMSSPKTTQRFRNRRLTLGMLVIPNSLYLKKVKKNKTSH